MSKPNETNWIPFKKKYTLEERTKEFIKIKSLYPGKIPIIVEPIGNAPKIDRHKYLIGSDVLMGQFAFSIRNRIKLNPEESIFFFVNNRIPIMSETIGTLYSREKDPSGFLILEYSKENTFG